MAKTMEMGPLIGAMFESKTPPKQDKKRAKKSKGEKSVTEPAQQHGELASSAEPKRPTDRQMIKDRAKSEMRRATEEWVSGRMDSGEHKAVHDRAKHVMSNKPVHEFKGKTGERKGKW